MEALNRVEKKENEQRSGCEIRAVKGEKGELTENMHTYWQERSKTFGFDTEFMLNVQGRIKPFLTECLIVNNVDTKINNFTSEAS